MATFDELMLNRRQVIGLGLSGAATLGLAGCGSSEPAPTPESGSAGSAEEPEIVAVDAAAFDALVASGPVADAAAIEKSEWATKVKEAGKLRVGTTQTSQLFSLLNEVDGVTRGFDAGLFQMLSNYILGDPAANEITLVQSSTRESVLQSDQVDAVFATYTINDERKEVISFAGPYYVGKWGLLVMADNTDINAEGDLAGKTIGVQAGSTQAGEAVLEYIPGAEILELGTDEEIRTALEQGRVDAYATDATLHMGAMIANPGKYRMAFEFGPDDPLGIGLPKDSDGVEFVNAFLKEIEDAGKWAELWQVCIGARTGIEEAPNPPAIGA